MLYIRRSGTGQADTVVADGGATVAYFETDGDVSKFKFPADQAKVKVDAVVIYSKNSGESGTFTFNETKARFIDLGRSADGTPPEEEVGAEALEDGEFEVTSWLQLARELSNNSAVALAIRREAELRLAQMGSTKLAAEIEFDMALEEDTAYLRGAEFASDLL